jgi:hypothetical protein
MTIHHRGIFPLVIMFIGAENMFSLVCIVPIVKIFILFLITTQVEAVVKTSITLPVKERIAVGLSRAGTSNSLKVLTYNIILGIIAFFARGATRQFCAFSVVVLVAHWFLVHTFFVAVLSIDLQRLELEELLQQNASFTPSIQPATPGQVAQPDGMGRKIMTTLRRLLRGRANKNISLFLVRTESFSCCGFDHVRFFLQLLATTGTLYFVTSPATRLSDTPIVPTSIPLAQQRKQDLLSGAEDPAWHTWRLLNPREDPLVHLRIEAPTLLMFRPADATQPTTRTQSSHMLSYSWIMRNSAWMARIVVLPIAATVAALYALLLYLLKDAERLEAQRHRAEAEPPSSLSTDPPKALLAFASLPRAHSTDIELLAASADGRTVAAVSIANELVLWNNGSAAPIALNAADVLDVGPSNLSAVITALTLDDTGSWCAAGTGAGVVAIWALPAPAGGRPQRVLRGASSAVTGLHFVTTQKSNPVSLNRPDQLPTIFTTYENGKMVEWNGSNPDCPVVVTPPPGRRVIWSTILRIPDTSRLVGGFANEDGSLDIVDLVPGFDPLLPSECRLKAGNPSDTVANFHACTVELGGPRALVIAAATEAGMVSLWDGKTGSCIALLDEPYGTLKSLRICAAPCKPCARCGVPPSNGFVLILTAGPIIHFFRLFLPLDNSFSTASSSSRLTCPHDSSSPSISPWVSSLGLHSHTPSTAPSTPIPPPRSRHASISEESASFPVSGHGVLSRRASEKDFVRHTAAPDTLVVPETLDDAQLGPSEPPQIPARWRSLVITRIADTTCERGAWDVTGSTVIGLRRRSRKPPESSMNGARASDTAQESAHTHVRDYGLSTASLERWEAWTFDPVEARVSASPLAALEPVSAPAFVARPAVTRETPRLPFTRVRPLVSGRMCFLAGFGNTVGLLMPTDAEKAAK